MLHNACEHGDHAVSDYRELVSIHTTLSGSSTLPSVPVLPARVEPLGVSELITPGRCRRTIYAALSKISKSVPVDPRLFPKAKDIPIPKKNTR
jgi:hypothetical protein